MRSAHAEAQRRYRQRQKAELERLRAAVAKPSAPRVTAAELRAVLDAFEERLVAELAKSAQERRQTNDKVDRLARQLAELRRHLGALETPQAPRISRRRPLGHD
jgi:hypothetical protein